MKPLIAQVIFRVVGVWCFLVGLAGSLLVFDMFKHPGGIGAEKLAGPIIALFALGFLFAGGVCFYVAKRLRNLHNKHKTSMPAIGS